MTEYIIMGAIVFPIFSRKNSMYKISVVMYYYLQNVLHLEKI